MHFGRVMEYNTTSDRVNYNGLTKNIVKDRFYKHCNSFKYESKASSTELWKHFWEMKWKGITKPNMHWSVIDHAYPYQNGSKRYNLCLTEKYYILTWPVNLIKKRSELVSKCCHETILPPRLWNTGLVSSGDSLTSYGEGASLALVGNPSSDGITIKMSYGVDVLHRHSFAPNLFLSGWLKLNLALLLDQWDWLR